MKDKSKFSETFIHDQVEYLPANVHYLHTDFLPSKYGKDDILFIPYEKSYFPKVVD